MFESSTLHHVWRRLRPVKTWYLLAACGVSLAVCVLALRHNNEQMVALRSAVYQADQQNTDVESALQHLRAYVMSHMNTDLAAGNDSVYPPIQLKYTYERLQTAADQQASAANSQVYTDAQHYCEQLYPGSFSGGPRVPCIESYVSSHGGAKAPTVPDALYKFNFASPSWSPDLAGWSLVLTAVLAVLAVLRFAAGKWLRRRAK